MTSRLMRCRGQESKQVRLSWGMVGSPHSPPTPSCHHPHVAQVAAYLPQMQV